MGVEERAKREIESERENREMKRVRADREKRGGGWE